MSSSPKRPGPPAPDPNWELELHAPKGAPNASPESKDPMLAHALLHAEPDPFDLALEDFGELERVTLPPPEAMSDHVARMMAEASLLELEEHDEGDRPTPLMDIADQLLPGRKPRPFALEASTVPADPMPIPFEARRSLHDPKPRNESNPVPMTKPSRDAQPAPAAKPKAVPFIAPTPKSSPPAAAKPAQRVGPPPLPVPTSSAEAPTPKMQARPTPLGEPSPLPFARSQQTPLARMSPMPFPRPVLHGTQHSSQSSGRHMAVREENTTRERRPASSASMPRIAREEPGPTIDLDELPAVFGLDAWDEPSSETPSLHTAPPSSVPIPSAPVSSDPAISPPFAADELLRFSPSEPSADRLAAIEARVTAGDYGRALVLAEAALDEHPGDPAVSTLAENCRDLLYRRYLERLGAGDLVPRLAMQRSALTDLSLDHRAGFLLSCVDGGSTVEEIIDVSAMPRLDAVRLLYELMQEGVIEMTSRR